MADPLVSTRIDRALARQLDALAKRKGERRAALLRALIERGLRQARLEDAVEAYRESHVSFGRAAELAGVSAWELHEALRARGVAVPRSFGRREAAEDLAQATGER